MNAAQWKERRIIIYPFATPDICQYAGSDLIIGKRGALDRGSVSKIPFEISDNTLERMAAKAQSAES